MFWKKTAKGDLKRPFEILEAFPEDGCFAKVEIEVQQQTFAFQGLLTFEEDKGRFAFTIAPEDEGLPEKVAKTKPELPLSFLTAELKDKVYSLAVQTKIRHGRLLYLHPLSESTLAQKREFYRVDTRLNVTYIRLSKKPIRRVSVEDATGNLSGGGIKFSTNEAIEAGENLRLEVEVPQLEMSLRTGAKVVRSVQRKNTDVFDIAVSFESLYESERDKLVGACNALQRQELVKKAQLRLEVL